MHKALKVILGAGTLGALGFAGKKVWAAHKVKAPAVLPVVPAPNPAPVISPPPAAPDQFVPPATGPSAVVSTDPNAGSVYTDSSGGAAQASTASAAIASAIETVTPIGDVSAAASVLGGSGTNTDTPGVTVSATNPDTMNSGDTTDTTDTTGSIADAVSGAVSSIGDFFSGGGEVIGYDENTGAPEPYDPGYVPPPKTGLRR